MSGFGLNINHHSLKATHLVRKKNFFKSQPHLFMKQYVLRLEYGKKYAHLFLLFVVSFFLSFKTLNKFET